MTTMTKTAGMTKTTGMTNGRTSTERPAGGRAGRILKRIAIGFGAVIVTGVLVVVFFSGRTDADMEDLRANVASIAADNPSPVYDPAAVTELPEPVQRYFDYVFVGPQQPLAHIEVKQSGDFRRPQTEGFNPTTAEQTIAVGTPALMFSARTNMLPGFWATAYDHYANGEMEMKAKILSTLTVVDETETPALNQTSLQRWLLESPLYPAALLPGGPVRWEPISDSKARAIVAADGQEASLVATFAADGSLESFQAEHDGDLTTPYHGSGEHVSRSDYREVDGVMIPHAFTIARAAGGELFPFWAGEVDTIEFTPAGYEQAMRSHAGS